MVLKVRNLRLAPCGAARSCGECPSTFCPLRSRSDGEFDVISDFDYVPVCADGIAVDIGTTTVAAVSYKAGKLVGKASSENLQRPWGADVLSRVQAANNGAAVELKDTIRHQIEGLLKTLEGKGHKTVISGNTAMISLYMGWDCSGMGRHPFRAHNTDTVREGDMLIPGCISAFVGGDITSGLYMCGFDSSDEVNMLIDLGTNGEMVIGNKDRLLCTSTAAGPAFEGGRISCGTGAVSGAICSVSLSENELETIDGAKPIGICGTGLVELAYELMSMGYMDKSGLLSDRYIDGFAIADGISITQRDIRELQTAKSAVRTGIEILIREYGATDINNIYIAGGFGKRLDIKKACGIGLLPERYTEKYRAVGNSALGGAVKILENGADAIGRIKAIAEDFPLAAREEFAELFMKYMEFGGDII